jgi:hypothetical protein
MINRKTLPLQSQLGKIINFLRRILGKVVPKNCATARFFKRRPTEKQYIEK